MAEATSFTLLDSYIPAYKAYLDASDDQTTALACLQQHIPTALEKLQLGKDKPRFNILSIGPGDGFVDQEILKIVQKGYLNADKHVHEVEILNTAVEPNTVYFGQYEELIQRQSDETSGSSKIKFDLKPMSYEEYAESKHDQNQYDMIHAIHSLYYVDIESTLKHFYYNELGEKGLITCYIANQSDIVGRTTSIVSQFRSGLRRKVGAGSNPAEIVIRAAENNSMKYEEIAVPNSIDVTSVFDEHSEEGRHMLNFLVYENNYRQTADQDELDEVLKMLKDISTEDDNGMLVVNCTHELILIYKTP